MSLREIPVLSSLNPTDLLIWSPKSSKKYELQEFSCFNVQRLCMGWL